MPKIRHGRPRAFDYIEATARLGSIRRAAEALNVASSAVNRMILELEEEVGTPLFERLPRGVRLTAAGEYMLAHIRRTAVDLEAVREQIDGLRGTHRGHVRIAVIEAAASGFLAPLLGRFHLQHRLISYAVHVMGSTDVAAAIQNDQADLGLALNPPESGRLRRMARMRQHMHAFVSREHPLAGRDRLRLNDCVGYPVAMGDETLGGRLALERVFEGAALQFRPFLISNSVELMMAVAGHSDGICFQLLPQAGRVEHGRLIALPVVDSRLPAFDLALIVSKRGVPAATDVLAEALKKAMQGEA